VPDKPEEMRGVAHNEQFFTGAPKSVGHRAVSTTPRTTNSFSQRRVFHTQRKAVFHSSFFTFSQRTVFHSAKPFRTTVDSFAIAPPTPFFEEDDDEEDVVSNCK
jgi:hypothetical protein